MSNIPGIFQVPHKCKCYAGLDSKSGLIPFEIERRACGKDDVVIDIKYAGICHSDIHQIREEWGKAIFPMVPGHEIAGEIVAIGENVTKFSVGQIAGIGCMVDSCRKCDNCKAGLEQYCSGKGMVGTYNSTAKYEHMEDFGKPTYGGYSKSIVCDQNYVCTIPTNLDLAGAVPLLCAGITTWSPMMHFGLRPNHKFAVVGLGGLGHMGVKFGKAFGCHTSVISRGNSKKESSINDLKADYYLDSTNEVDMETCKGTFDFILCTIAADFDPAPYLNLLKFDGTMVIVGVPSQPLKVPAGQLIFSRKTLTGSLIGGIQETQEMLDFCGRNNITCDVEVINANQINECYERAIKSDVKYRFVIDTASI